MVKGDYMRTSGYLVKGLVAISVLLMLLAIGYGFWIQREENVSKQASAWKAEEQEDLYTSNVTAADCKLCSRMDDLYKDEDNLGIIYMNSGELVCIEINQYDNSGKLIEESVGFMSNDMINMEDGFKTTLTINPDRGYARAKIYMEAEKRLDMEKSVSNFCNDCLTRIFEDGNSDEVYGVGLINFKTGEVKLLDTGIRGFMLGDYYVSCKFYAGEKVGDVSEMELLIFYCPERYSK